MTYDDELAERVRRALSRRRGVTEKKMFGGVSFLLRDHMFCGVVEDRLMIRVGPDKYAEALGEPHVREMDFTGRPLRGFVYIERQAIDREPRLKDWLLRGLKYVRTLPPK